MRKILRKSFPKQSLACSHSLPEIGLRFDRNSPALLLGSVRKAKDEPRSPIDDFGFTFFTVAIFGQEGYELFVNEIMPAFAR